MRYERIARNATDRNGLADIAPNPSMHYRWAVANNTNLRASIAQTFRLPKFDDVNPWVTQATGAGAGAGTLTNLDKGGNTELKAERATGIELGVELFLSDNRGVVGFNLYDRKARDFIQKTARQAGLRALSRAPL
nr:TonB-dependent receptor [Chitinivorax sp. B]